MPPGLSKRSNTSSSDLATFKIAEISSRSAVVSEAEISPQKSNTYTQAFFSSSKVSPFFNFSLRFLAFCFSAFFSALVRCFCSSSERLKSRNKRTCSLNSSDKSLISNSPTLDLLCWR